MLTSAWVGLATMMLTVAELFAGFGSPTVLETLGVSVSVVPEGVAAFTFTTNGKLAVPLGKIVCPALSVQVNVPVPPTAIVGVQVQVAGGVKETSVVFVGIATVNVAFVSVAGPLFVTVCV